MAEDQAGVRRDQLHTAFLWTKLFGAFRVALDFKKLLLAAAGILVMSFGWWLLSVIFWAPRSEPKKEDYKAVISENDSAEERKAKELQADSDYQEAKRKWDLLKKTAGKEDGRLRKWPWSEPRGP